MTDWVFKICFYRSACVFLPVYCFNHVKNNALSLCTLPSRRRRSSVLLRRVGRLPTTTTSLWHGFDWYENRPIILRNALMYGRAGQSRCLNRIATRFVLSLLSTSKASSFLTSMRNIAVVCLWELSLDYFTKLSWWTQKTLTHHQWFNWRSVYYVKIYAFL